jgi:uroporphyrinogen-III synthase
MTPPSLVGLRVLLTRPEGDGMEEWAAAFSAAGALPISYPTLVAAPPRSWDEVDAALARLAGYDWLIFTSQTAVAFILGRLSTKRLPPDCRPRIAAVGAKTAQAIEAGGGRVARVPIDKRQEGLVQALADLSPGTRVLVPIAAGGRTLLAETLRARGCVVDVVTVYETQPKPDLPAPPTFDVATFASPSALRAFLAGPGKAVLAKKTVAVIGPTTAHEARAHGLVPVVSESPSAQDLIRAIADSRPAKGDP